MQSTQSATVMFVMLLMVVTEGQNIITSDCGRRPVEYKAAILKGFQTYHWPWHAAIYHQDDKSLPAYKCGGTLINANSILTAAHCITKSNKPLPPSIISASLGKLNLDVNESSAQHFEIARIFVHPSYNSIDLVNDIGVIQLSANVLFNNFVEPVCLWRSDKLKLSEVVGRVGTVVGWGVSETGELSNELQQASLPVVSSLQCLASNRPFFGTLLTETNFCAGFRNGTSVCEGDSGGSMTFEENGLYYIRGIVSLSAIKRDSATGRTSCDSSNYVMFTDVAKFLPWIREVTMECKINVECDRTYLYDYACRIHTDINISEQKCRIIFNEFNTNVRWLDILGEVLVIPDLSDALNKFENLNKIQLHNSKLKVVERSALTAFKSIETLFLNGNKITQLASDTFADLKKLKELGIDNNKLKEFDGDLFKELSELKVLYLYKNQLEILPVELFRNNKELMRLEMQNNLLKELQPDLFKNLQNLEWLDFSGNQLEILPQGLFRNNGKLQKILVHNNKIKTIESDFQHLSKLVEINLIGNVCIDESCDVSTFCDTYSLPQMQRKIWQKCSIK